jgi:DNA mismatch repair protein MutS
MSSPKITPMIKQYLSIKEEYADAILLYRMGDFYEMFFEDAEIASRQLEITLTSRNKKDEFPIPMCGVPHKAVQGYISRLLEHGNKVAICDQVEDSSMAKGLVKRDVVRVITPGMIIENEFLDEKTNNYILAVAHDNDIAGLACLDLSTGTFRVSETRGLQSVLDEALRISPSEILLPEFSGNHPFFSLILNSFPEKAVTFLGKKAFEFKTGRKRLLNQFNTLSLEGFGCENIKSGISAAGALMYYIQKTQKQKTEHINRIEPYKLGNFLWLDDISFKNLEIVNNIQTGSTQGTLLGIIDHTVTAMGGRLLKRWLRYPLLNLKDIEDRLNAVQEAKNNLHIRRSILECLQSVYDLERLGSKISMGHSNARDLVALKRSLKQLPEIWTLISQLESGYFTCSENLDNLIKLSDLIEKAIREDAPPVINEGGMIKTGFNKELDELIRVSRSGKNYLAQLEVEERKLTRINTLKVRYNKVFGYYIEVPKARSKDVPPNYVRKQTLVNAERYITDELKTFESKVFGAEERRAELEYEIFNSIRKEVVANNSSIQTVARFLARLDCILDLAEIADQNSYCRPEMNVTGEILIEEGRHPVVEKMITGERFVPNTIKMDNVENQILIITGPNMAGKSTILRQVAILVLMAQMGSFVPAKKASIHITDRIFTRVGALDNLSQGQSTFMVEMQETANILNNSTEQSLVILDEIGRGTSTFDGLSIAWAVAEYLHDLNQNGVKTLFATHYHELTELALKKPRVKNFNIAVREWNDKIIFLRKLVEGGTNRSYGIQVARLAGIPDKVLSRAKKILTKVENGEYSLDDTSAVAANGDDSKTGHKQLRLFRKPERLILENLSNLDITKMTPLEALNYLDELGEKAKNLTR